MIAGRQQQMKAGGARSATLETPAFAGYRAGMSTTGLIERKLARIYGVSADCPQEIDTLLRSLEGKSAKVD